MPTATAKRAASTSAPTAATVPKPAAGTRSMPMTHEPISIGPYWVLFYRTNFDVLKAGSTGAFATISDNIVEWRRFCGMLLQRNYQGLQLSIDGVAIATLLGTPPGAVKTGAGMPHRAAPKVSVASGRSANGSGG